jgi:hypothetical protein
MTAFPGDHFILMRLTRYHSGSVQHVHCEHFLEHLERRDSLELLTECHRVLDSAGTMRIIVPDSEKYMRAYVADDQEFFAPLVHLGGHQEALKPRNLFAITCSECRGPTASHGISNPSRRRPAPPGFRISVDHATTTLTRVMRSTDKIGGDRSRVCKSAKMTVRPNFHCRRRRLGHRMAARVAVGQNVAAR